MESWRTEKAAPGRYKVSSFKIGDLVVLKSGSMRMCVETIGEDGRVHTVWCNEGVIGRDRFDVALLNKWEHREDSARGSERGGHRGGGGKPYGGEREGGGRSYGGRKDRDADDRGPRKTGWDGKPRDKKFYRKDG